MRSEGAVSQDLLLHGSRVNRLQLVVAATDIWSNSALFLYSSNYIVYCTSSTTSCLSDQEGTFI